MIGPLWGYFSFIKDKVTNPLSIDQYQYLIEALYNDSRTEISSADELLTFTKIFWLNDIEFEGEYDRLFRKFFKWKDLFGVNEILTEPKGPLIDDNKPEKVITEQPNKPTPKPSDSEGIEPILPKEIERKTGMVDFELVLKDGASSPAALSNPDKKFEHNFSLGRAEIMPFNVRNFAQRLRRKVETSEKIVSSTIDVEKMILEFTKRSYIENISYLREDSNQSNVVLFSDRFGSMFAHEYLDTLYSSAMKQIPYCQFEHYFYYNMPTFTEDGSHLHLQKVDGKSEKINSENLKWNNKTWFFILSDAGAHSGMVRRERLKKTIKMWKYLNLISQNVYWINPVPFEYMNDCTAKRLQMVIPMYYPDQIDMTKLINNSIASK